MQLYHFYHHLSHDHQYHYYRHRHHEYDEENPLVDLCKCTGGIKYTHYICLKYWMQTKLSKKENEKKTVTSYNIKSFNCEICKTPFPCKVFF